MYDSPTDYHESAFFSSSSLHSQKVNSLNSLLSSVVETKSLGSVDCPVVPNTSSSNLNASAAPSDFIQLPFSYDLDQLSISSLSIASGDDLPSLAIHGSAPNHKKTENQPRRSGKKQGLRNRQPFIPEEIKFIDQRYADYIANNPTMSVASIANKIQQELYHSPISEVSDRRVILIRRKLEENPSHFIRTCRSYESVLHHLYNIRKKRK